LGRAEIDNACGFILDVEPVYKDRRNPPVVLSRSEGPPRLHALPG
jgi:hypothetical protein